MAAVAAAGAAGLNKKSSPSSPSPSPSSSSSSVARFGLERDNFGIILNTAAGVSRVPQDYLNVARVLNLSEWKIFTRILFPSVLPHLMTGIRLSMGVAWLVIVAAEMLTGGTGIGFWVWDEWNNLNVEHILIAIFIVGIIGLLLEQVLVLIANRFNYE